LTNDKVAKNLKKLAAFSSSDNYVSELNLSLLHRSVLGLSRCEIKPLLEDISAHTIDGKDAEGQTPLYWAARRGDVQAVSLLLGAGADSNGKTNRGTTILAAATMSSNTECIWKILETGCNINYQQKDGYTPLHHCCRYEVDISIVKALLNRGADRNARTLLGHTPLMIATFNVNTITAEFLVDSHADLDIQGKDGGCALHHAIMSGDHQVVRHLLKQGANHLLKTANGETLLHFLAQRNGDYEILRSLEPFGLDGINVEDVTRKQKLNALQIAERHHGGDADWLKLFKSLIEKVRLGSSNAILENAGYEDALEYVA
jgi:ankyrin repeat protein